MSDRVKFNFKTAKSQYVFRRLELYKLTTRENLKFNLELLFVEPLIFNHLFEDQLSAFYNRSATESYSSQVCFRYQACIFRPGSVRDIDWNDIIASNDIHVW